jgi:hypothetical protein
MAAHGKIFVSYRRDDAPGDARGIYERLGRSFGEGKVFMDVDQLLAGQRFDRELDKALAECDVLIAVIGSRWMDLLSECAQHGKRDYVRDEIAAALQREIIVIPVMMGREANMPPLPRAQDLPGNIRDLVLYQKHNIAHESFGRDAAHLIAALQSLLRERRGPGRWRALAVAGLSGLAVTGVLLAYSTGIAPQVHLSTGRHTGSDDLATAAVTKWDPSATASYQAAEPRFGDAPSNAAELKTATKGAAPSVNIAGPWRDNWGIRYDVEQEGRAFRFSASGPSCRQGYKFNSSGSGTIDGASANSNYSSDHEGSYNSTFQSSGSCQATLFANGTTIKSTCDDKVCGHNDFLLTRE